MTVTMDRKEELQLIENYPNHKIKKGETAFCAVSLQSELSEKKRTFHHNDVKKKKSFIWPRSRGNRGAASGYRR